MIEWGLDYRSLTSYFEMQEITAPSVVPSNALRLYAKDKSGVSTLYYKDDALVEHDLSIGGGGAVTGTGTTNRLAYWNSSTSIAANAALTANRVPFADSNGLLDDDADMVWDDTNKRLGLGLSGTGSGVLSFRLEIWGPNNDNSNYRVRRSSADNGGPGINFQKSRGTSLGSESAALSGDFLGAIGWGGYDGSAWQFNSVLMRAIAAENFSGTARGAHLVVETITAGGTTRTEKLRLTDAGSLVVGAQSALSTSATDGFLYIPTSAGAPTGTPTAFTGKVAMEFDTTNNRLYVYDGGWISVVLA